MGCPKTMECKSGDAEAGEPNVIDSEHKDSEVAKLIFINISGLTRGVQFLILTLATFFCFLAYSLIQESLFSLEGFKPFGWFLTLIQCICYTIFGLIELQFKGEKSRIIPLKSYAIIAFLTMATMGLSNASVGYLNYPTHVVFKCCQLIPVLVGGMLIQGKTTNLIEVTAALSISIGLVFFTLADSTISPNFNSYGVILVCLALCADGALGNVQEKTFKKYQVKNFEMILYSYSIGFLYVLVELLVTEQLFPAIVFCNAHPYITYGYALLISLLGYLGVNIVLTIVRHFGALLAITVTTCRKAITIILSFVFFYKPFTFAYVWSGLLVVLGIYLSLYNKNKDTMDKVFSKCIDYIRKDRVSKRQIVNGPQQTSSKSEADQYETFKVFIHKKSRYSQEK